MSEKLENRLHKAMIDRHFNSYRQIVLAAQRTGSVSVAVYDFGVKNMCVDLMQADVLKFKKREMIKENEHLVYVLTDAGTELALEIKSEKP